MLSDYRIYIVVSQTGTVVSRIIQFFTKDKYNHSSISLNPELTNMYSFGRLYPRFPLPGGFIQENIYTKVFALHPNTNFIVFEVNITQEQYNKLNNIIADMIKRPHLYSYNLFGLFFAALHKEHKAKNKYYCSEFVKYVLEQSGIINKNELPTICKPMELMNIHGHVIYEGSLDEYKNNSYHHYNTHNSPLLTN